MAKESEANDASAADLHRVQETIVVTRWSLITCVSVAGGMIVLLAWELIEWGHIDDVPRFILPASTIAATIAYVIGTKAREERARLLAENPPE